MKNANILKLVKRNRFFCCLAAILTAACASAQNIPCLIDAFQYPTSDAARLSWKASAQTPQAIVSADNSTRLPCVFSQKTTRVYWDKTVKLNLAGRSSLELDITCPHPEAIASLLVYAKSGDGWYVWRARLNQPGRLKHLFPLHQAATEGKPAGWDQISAIRISAFRGSGDSTFLTLHSLKALSCTLALIQASEKTAGSEALAARNAAARISRWLTDLGIPHLLFGEDNSTEALRTASLAILPYSPAPSEQFLNNIERMAQRGGKIMVFYSSSERLAGIMSLALDKYQTSVTPGHWSSFTFVDAAPAGAPKTVFQDSSNIFSVKPTGKSGRILAFWNDENNRRLKDPAWIQTDRGLWMTHVLLDGDDENKKLMLASLLALYEPSIWRNIIEHYQAAAVRVGPFSNMAAAQAGIREIARINCRAKLVNEPLDKALETTSNSLQLTRQGNYPKAVEQAFLSRRHLAEAYALAQAPVAGEFRGLWCHSALGVYPGDWKRTAALARDSGFNAIFVNLLWAGAAHYQSSALPVSDLARLYGDQLEAASKATRALGLQLHLWMVCWKLGPAPANFANKLRAEGRLQVNSKLQTINDWLCPSHPANAALELAAAREAITRQPVNGIHLDYIRFPDSSACFCPNCRRVFEAHIGKTLASWPGDVLKGPLAASWQKWRQGVITDFVRAVRNEARRINPEIKVSAAVYSGYPECAASIGQNWGEWLQNDLVDFVCPMTYQNDITQFSGLTRKHLDLPGAKNKIYPGLGVTASESRLSSDQVISQITWLRANNTRSFLLFDFNPLLAREILPMLKLGLTEP